MAASNHLGQPTVIAGTSRAYGMGVSPGARRRTSLISRRRWARRRWQAFRDRFHLPLSDRTDREARIHQAAKDSAEYKYMVERRMALGGFLPARRQQAAPLEVPDLSAFEACSRLGRGSRVSTTMAFVRLLRHPPQGQEHRQARGADRGRMSRAPSVWKGCSRQIGIWSVGRPAVHAAGPGPAHVLQGRQERPDPAGGHQRGRRHVLVDRGGDVVLDARRCR